MATRNPAVDAYVAKARPFAQPILKKIRTLAHKAVPGVTEELKWSTPHFTYKGMFCGMAAFKEHCIFGFWKHSLPETRDRRMTQAIDWMAAGKSRNWKYENC